MQTSELKIQLLQLIQLYVGTKIRKYLNNRLARFDLIVFCHHVLSPALQIWKTVHYVFNYLVAEAENLTFAIIRANRFCCSSVTFQYIILLIRISTTKISFPTENLHLSLLETTRLSKNTPL